MRGDLASLKWPKWSNIEPEREVSSLEKLTVTTRVFSSTLETEVIIAKWKPLCLSFSVMTLRLGGHCWKGEGEIFLSCDKRTTAWLGPRGSWPWALVLNCFLLVFFLWMQLLFSQVRLYVNSLSLFTFICNYRNWKTLVFLDLGF